MSGVKRKKLKRMNIKADLVLHGDYHYNLIAEFPTVHKLSGTDCTPAEVRGIYYDTLPRIIKELD